MSNEHLYSVTVSRINEGMNFTMTARRVTIDPDGSLSIEGGEGAAHLSAGRWDGVEVKAIPGSVGPRETS
jgi:RES domain-containing protein